MPGLGKHHHINLEGRRTGSVLQKAMAAQAEIHFGRRPGERWRERGRFNQPLFTTNRARPSAPRTSHHFLLAATPVSGTRSPLSSWKRGKHTALAQ